MGQARVPRPAQHLNWLKSADRPIDRRQRVRWNLARLDSPKTDSPARKPRRYRLVSQRVEAQTERVRRFRLARMEALPRLENLEPALDIRSNRKA